ncbi:hypothetical protein M3Y94_00403800 [Aphelenchoides besseyi]|nr:hypothetical protein M3Y94_00403800 [Aphelenchoides besseyi]
MRQITAVGSVEGQFKVRFESESLDNKRGLMADLKLRTSAIATHLHKAEVWSPIIITGVQTVQTAEVNGPLEAKIRSGSSMVEVSIRPPQDHKIRFFALHTLPMTYTSRFDMDTRTQREPRVRTVHNRALEQAQREFHLGNQQHKTIQLEGHYHEISDAAQLLQALYTTENNVHYYYVPSEQTPKELKVRVLGSMFQKHNEHSRPEMDSFYTGNKGGFQPIYEEDYEGMELEKDEQRQSRLSSYQKQYAGKNAYKHQLTVETEARYPQKDLQDGDRTEGSTVNGGADEKNQINLRLQAEPTKKMMWQRTEQSDNQWSRFMNKIDLVAEYQLRPQQKHSIQRYFDLLKAKFFWQLTTQHHDGQSGVVRASMIIDPMTRRHANVTVQTPQERLRIQSVQVPTTILVAVAYPLERRPSNLRSIGDLFQSVSSFGGAECRFNERRVRTFDGTAYKAPISSCWSVLAKDCSREEPRFVVMMKKTDEEKKLRIITQDNTIELIGQSENEKVKVMVDGEHVKDEERLSDEGIEVNFNNVYVSKRGINVEFDGQEAKVKIGGQYKNLQCGLCGHYNDEEDDVFRMGNNQRSNNLKEFHRSYTMKNEECEEGKLNKFYQQNDNKFSIRQQQKGRQNRHQWYDDNSSSDESTQYSNQEEWQNSDEQDDQKQVQPVKRTQVIEYNHKVCFSSEPVERCPRGSTPDDDAETKPVKAQFFCVERTSTEGRQLLRQVRKGKTVDSNDRSPAFVETVEQPTKCLAYGA